MRSQYPLQHFQNALPPNPTVEELKQFIDYNFRYKLTATFPIQIYVCTGLMGILVLIGIFITTQRILTKTFWLFRLHETRGRRLVVCNATVLFVNVAGVFAALLIALTWSTLLFARGQASTSTGRWISYGSGVVFLPLLGCAWCCAFGVLYACPGVIESDSIFQAGQKSRKPSATFLNTVFFVAPLIVTLLIVGLSVTAGHLTGRAFDLWEAWTPMMMALDPSAPVPAELVATAAMIWYQNAIGTWWFVLTFCVWAGIAGAFAILHTGISLYLLNVMRNHLRDNDQLTKSGARYNISHTTSYRGVFYPSVDVPHGVIWTATNANATANALAPAFKVIVALCLFVELGVVSFFITASIHASVALEKLGRSPEAYGLFVSKILLVAFWISIIAGGGAFFAITGKLLQPLIDGYISRRQIIQAAHEKERRERLKGRLSLMSRLREWIGMSTARSIGSSAAHRRPRSDSTTSIEFTQRQHHHADLGYEQDGANRSGDLAGTSFDETEGLHGSVHGTKEGADSYPTSPTGARPPLGSRSTGKLSTHANSSGAMHSSVSLERTLHEVPDATVKRSGSIRPDTVMGESLPETERGWTYDPPVVTIERMVHFSDAQRPQMLVYNDQASSYPPSIADD